MASTPKLEAFRAFDWDGDERWKAYVRNIELPGTDAAAAMLKVKAKWYKREIDSTFEVDWVTSQSKPAPRSEPSPQPSAAPRSTANQPSARPATGGWGSGSRPGGSSTAGMSSIQSKIIPLHLLMVVLALFHVVPVLPISSCSLRCYWWFMRVAVCTQGYMVYSKFGAPPVWPFNWQALQRWLSQAMVSTDFFYAITCFAFMSSRSSMTLAMIPTLLSAIRSVLAVASHQFAGSAWWQQTGAKAQAWASSREAFLTQISTWSELALGLLLVVMLITPNRNFLLLFFYWNMLKMRYVTPESAANHRMAWAVVDRRTAPYREKLPLLEKAVEYIRAWFLNMRN